jgi:hypothetical protein
MGKGAETGVRENLATKASEVPEVEAELPQPLQTSDKGAFSPESMTKYKIFFATAAPPKAQDAVLLNSEKGSLGTWPWVWVVLFALITALFFSLYLNLTVKPRVIVVEKKIPVTATSEPAIKADELSKEGNQGESARDYDFVPDPGQEKQGK